nr:brain and acute leukemia cytoplasmic protein isoform X3 [Cavia porcellus]
MGCGGSRADALEPRYLESWTRDTESTWLTGSDTDAGPDGAREVKLCCPDWPRTPGLQRCAFLSLPNNWDHRWRILLICAWMSQSLTHEGTWQEPVPTADSSSDDWLAVRVGKR